MSEQENLEIARLAMERWNSGDLDGVLDLYAEEAAMHPAADWPEQASSHGATASGRTWSNGARSGSRAI